eukprot:TRINITY_DN2947_c0_g1_i4.p1 TRINITY_DN2947_c0_g1~~TRINITY_DN2947_c0_g1_i4.p1  ORF type:complete len:477 (-),score=186.38 TRINITY_DN2947_c0_g1_i4:182-1612(-)
MEESFPVSLVVYDLSGGLARSLSQAIIGKQIEGIWHTGVVVYGKEFFWGGIIQEAIPGTTQYGRPIKTIKLGDTFIPQEIFREWLDEVIPNYSLETYSILNNNCNNFSNEVSQFLTGTSIPQDILNLPSDALNTPSGAMIKNFILQMEQGVKMRAMNQLGGVISRVNDHSNPLPQLDLFGGYQQPLSNSQLNSGGNSSKTEKLEKKTERKHIKEDNKPMISDQGTPNSIVNRLKSMEKSDERRDSLDLLEKYLEKSIENEEEPDQRIFQLFDNVFRDATTVDKSNSSLLSSYLFLFRLFILRRKAAGYYVKEGRGTLVHISQHFLSLPSSFSTLSTMALTVMTNLFFQSILEDFLLEKSELILSNAIEAFKLSDSTSVRQIVGTLFYNYSLIVSRQSGKVLSSLMDKLASGLVEFIEKKYKLDEETLFRLLLAIGHLLLGSSSAEELRKKKESLLSNIDMMEKDKIREISREIKDI